MNSLSSNILLKVQALQGLDGKIRSIVKYLADVKSGKLPANNKIIFILQVHSLNIIVNNKFAAKFELLIADKSLFSKKQRYDVRNLHLCDDPLHTSPAHPHVCG